MEYITIFGDIHANLPALEAVLTDMDERHLQNRYCLGDLVGYGTFPNEVTSIIHDSGLPCIMGNYDQGVGNDSDECGCAYKTQVEEERGKRSIAWTNAHTTSLNKQYLRDLPPHIPLELGGRSVLLVHGSPRKINEYLYEDRPNNSLERVLDAAEVEILVCGHTHLPYHKVLPSGRHIINAGSVGKPKDKDNRACYVVISTEGEQLKVEFERVPYDIERAAKAIEATEMPHEFATMIREGKG